MIRFSRLNLTREGAVAVIAGVMLVFAGWAWGGVVLWTQFVTCGLGALALLVALTPRDASAPSRADIYRGYIRSLAFGGVIGVCVAAHDWVAMDNMRAATLQLLPDAELPPPALSDWLTRGALLAAGLCLAGMFATALRVSTNARATLLRFPPFWIGIALFGYIAVQSLNPWGLVVERDLTWKVIPQNHVSWLPAGLDAPFIGDRDPGGMNGWRQMLILSGPWLMLCALRAAAWHRRLLVPLAWVAVVNALAIGLVGLLVSSGTETSFLGFKAPATRHAPFGPFVYRNHAGIYLYLAAALALALTAHLVAMRGDRADRGGPHLLAGAFVFMLCLMSAGTLSIGATLAAAAVLLLVPCLYFIDRRISSALSPAPALILLTCGFVMVYAVADSTNLQSAMRRIEKKREYVETKGFDDRTPIRRAAYAQISDGSVSRWAFGWGAGSYRWLSPPYFKLQPEYVDGRGRLRSRANFAHCDWLQAFLEWGSAGSALAFAGLGWLGLRFANAWKRRSASLLAAAAGIAAALLHATVDFIFYFTPALTMLALMVAWLASVENLDASRDRN